jgi:hypothetical protein
MKTKELLLEVTEDNVVREVDYATIEDVTAWLAVRGYVVTTDATKQQRSEHGNQGQEEQPK